LIDPPSKDSAVSLQVVPAEFGLKAGNKLAFDVFTLDSNGKRIAKLTV
jgi:hypothetical protein